MADGYTDTPYNFSEIEPWVITDVDRIVAEIYGRKKCYFYDTCSFRRHAGLNSSEAKYFLKYVQKQYGIIIITRCILMELASHSGLLNQEYVQYMRTISEAGIKILVVYEEDFFAVMEMCFSTNAVINSYLCWAVRMIKNPVSTITATLEQEDFLYDKIIKGKKLENCGMYEQFFKAVRKNKESGDNLGEELLAICLHMLSHIPEEQDGKFCVITDDKGAGSKIDMLFKKTARQYRGKKIVIFSTAKLVQVLYNESILKDKNDIIKILSTGQEGLVSVLGTRIFDLRNDEITMSCEKLAELIMMPNGINITF